MSDDGSGGIGGASAASASYVEVSGTRLWVERYPGSGPPLVLLHGFGSSAATWWSVAGPLAAHHALVAYDRCGFGSSPLPPERARRAQALTRAGSVAACLALLDEAGIERCVLVGHSAGAELAAMVTIEAPERIMGLVFIAPAIGIGGGAPPAARWLARRRVVRALARHSAGRVGPRLLPRALRSVHHDPSRVAPEILSAYRQAFDGPTWGETAWEMAALDDPPMPLARLDELHHPVLVIAGDRDRVVRSEHIEAVCRHLRRHRVVTVLDCGHCPQEEHPEVVADAVVGFVADEISSAS